MTQPPNTLIFAVVVALFATTIPDLARAEIATVGDLFAQGTNLVQTAGRLLIIVGSFVGIGLTARSLYQLAMEENESERGKHLVAAGVGSLFTIFGVIVGVFSGLFV